MSNKPKQPSFFDMLGSTKSKHVTQADWGDCDPLLIAQLIANACHDGLTVSFGYTRDGGAYYLGFYDGNETKRVYLKPDNPDEDLRGLIEMMTD